MSKTATCKYPSKKDKNKKKKMLFNLVRAETKGRGRHFRMASFASLSLTTSFLSNSPNPNPRFHLRNQSPFKCSAKTEKKSGSGSGGRREAPPAERKSFAVATGELFLGLSSMLARRGKPIQGPISAPFTTAGGGEDSEEENRIASVVADSIDPDVIWEQRVRDVEAERDRKKVTSPGFSFSAAGLLFPYHLGAAQFLIEKGYIKETTPLAGSSAGAIVCAVIASGSSMEDGLKATKILAEDCRLKGTAFRLGAVLRDVLEKFLPDDVHTRSTGRVRVAVTQILWRPRGLLVDQFDSKEDLINAVFTSSFIPGYLAPRPATMFRNRLCIDGGLTLFMPPTSASETVRVCAFPADRLGFKGIAISPHCNPDQRATPRQLFKWALEPAEDDVLDRLFELGYLDAAVWAEQNPVESIVQDNCISSSS